MAQNVRGSDRAGGERIRSVPSAEPLSETIGTAIAETIELRRERRSWSDAPARSDSFRYRRAVVAAEARDVPTFRFTH
jgi:hypothetical protein